MSGWRLSRAAVPAVPAAPAEPVSVEAKRWSAGALELGMWVPETGEMNENSIVGYMWQPANYG